MTTVMGFYKFQVTLQRLALKEDVLWKCRECSWLFRKGTTRPCMQSSICLSKRRHFSRKRTNQQLTIFQSHDHSNGFWPRSAETTMVDLQLIHLRSVSFSNYHLHTLASSLGPVDLICQFSLVCTDSYGTGPIETQKTWEPVESSVCVYIYKIYYCSQLAVKLSK